MPEIPDAAALIDAALKVRDRAYAPYSQFLVGAALLGANGTVYLGCNVENVSFGLTQCAERTAVGNAISDGSQDWRAIAVVAAGGVTPCGACRQVLAEFNPQLKLLLVDADSPRDVVETDLAVLLPQRFLR